MAVGTAVKLVLSRYFVRRKSENRRENDFYQVVFRGVNIYGGHHSPGTCLTMSF